MNYQITDGGYTVTGYNYFDPTAAFDCGQCFRFSLAPDGAWEGVVRGAFVRICAHDAGLHCSCESEAVLTDTLLPFLALDTDYTAVRADIAAHVAADATMHAAMKHGAGIRILRQEAWEALCSFIISQNNNIPRIKKIIETLCRRYGTPIDGIHYAFPTPAALAAAGEQNIFACGAGFRAKYIADAAERVASGTTDLTAIAALPTEQAGEELQKIKGVGPKVAACVLLFGLGKTDAFPIDVWMKRIIDTWYEGSLDPASIGAYAGIAQQYLFYYAREMGI